MLAWTLPVSAQLNTGRISGQVTDQTGGAIGGATVTVIDVARGQNRVLTADAAGTYAAPNLTPGIYTVRAEFMGFQTVDRQNVEVQVGGDVRIDLTLQPGAQTQTVTVTESIPVVNTTNAQTGGVLENSLITDLPTIGRNYRYQQAFVPGVFVGLGTTGTVQVDVNGTTDAHGGNSMVDGLYDQTSFTAEGTFGGSGEAGFTTILPLDAIQEVNLVTNPKAEYGWIPGVTASIGLKSGTNDIHGNAYAFGRDTALEARNAFASVRTPVEFEQFGGTVGGPIKKNKIFFFGGYEGFRESASSIVGNITPPTLADLDNGGAPKSTVVSIPDAIADVIANHGGVAALSQLSVNIAGCDPTKLTAGMTTGALVVPACGKNQFSAPGLWDNPNLGNVPNDGRSDNGLLKIDYHINDHHSLNGSFAYGSYFESAAGNSAQKITQNYWEEVLGVNGNNMERVVEIWTPNSSWLNEARWGRDVNIRPVGRAECSPNGDLSNPTGLGASTGGFGGPDYLKQYGLDSGALGCGIPTITLSGGGAPNAQLGFSNARADNEVDEQGADSVSYTRGAHQFKFGVDVRAISFVGAKTLDSLSGVISFNSSLNPAPFAGASALEDFLVGAPASETIAAGTNVRNVSTDQIAAFVQDDWRIKPRLTLNLGIREEIVTPPTSSTNNLGNFDPTSPTGIVAVTQPFKNHYNFEPRFGLAWDITGKGTTTVRAGIGVLNGLTTIMNFVSGGPNTYDTAPTGEQLFAADGSSRVAPGNGKSGTVAPLPGTIIWPMKNSSSTPLFPASFFSSPGCGNGAPPVNPVVGAPAVNPNPCAMVGGDPNLQYYHYIFWNVNFQHAITNNLSLDVGYVASRSTGILQSVNYDMPAPSADINQATPGPGPGSEQARAIYASQFPWFSSITLNSASGMNWYRSLQISVTQRLSHGLTITSAYTYSGNRLTQGVLNPNVPIQGLNGPYSGNLYPAHNLSVTASYQIPGIKTPGQMLEGWQLHTNIGVISSLPFSPLDTKDDFAGAGNGGALGTGAIPWTLLGSADPFNQIFGRAGTIPCYGVAAGNTFKAGAFAKSSTGCIIVPNGGLSTPWANLPAACIQGAKGEASGVGAVAGTSTQNGLPLYQLAAVGCYMVNGSAIVPPAEGTYGTMVQDSLRGPGRTNVDASVTKDWKVKERYTVQFRAEAFNIFNRTQYLGQGTDPSNPAKFGLAQFTPDVRAGDPIQGRGGPRYFQFGLKLLF